MSEEQKNSIKKLKVKIQSERLHWILFFNFNINSKINHYLISNSNNSNKNIDNISKDDGLSAGGIIGIIIGSIAITLIVGVSCSYYLYKHFLKKRKSMPVYEEPKRIETAETVVWI